MAEHISGNDRSGDTVSAFAAMTRRPSALSASYIIDPVSNRVAGHGTADEHIDTVLTQIVSQIVAPDAKVYVVCISENMSRDSSMVGGLFVVRPSATF
ncbi:hypothetical protein LTR37_006374 [Vermiconidia calcicola]|uniref:Uncharacterized protein n=1 Tax=Vermiconidia calcicola TaxID=1690605 RepID=A0ACC3NG94_9PEZI|nr:hypothetical protein LTR37_006374 [Vermiconidia calcicola]